MTLLVGCSAANDDLVEQRDAELDAALEALDVALGESSDASEWVYVKHMPDAPEDDGQEVPEGGVLTTDLEDGVYLLANGGYLFRYDGEVPELPEVAPEDWVANLS